jgi:hypothetical protein
MVLIKVADNAYQQQKTQDNATARELNDGAHILGIAVNSRDSRSIARAVGSRVGGDGIVVILLRQSFLNKTSFSVSVEYIIVILDEQGEGACSW